jgi:tetratricopeptide (TPR) repeat protein
VRFALGCKLAGAALLLASSLLAQNATPSAQGPTAAGTAITRAESAIDQQQWAQVETILRQLVAADAKDARAWFDLGYVMHAQKKYPEAIDAYRRAVAAQPDSFECNLNLGMTLAHEGQADASKYLQAATHLKPTGDHPQQSMASAWAALAEVQGAADAKSALDSWLQAVALAPDDAQDRLGYGGALERAGDLAGAEREYRKASELQPASTAALEELSSLFMWSNRSTEAEESLRRLLALSPQNQSGHRQLGLVLSAEKKDAEALPELQKAVELQPDDWDALRGLAFVEERAKQFAAAESSYRRLLTHNPNDAELHNGLGSVLLAQLRYADAQREFDACLRLRPDWGEAYGQLALAASDNKDYQLAIHSLDARKKLLPEGASSYFLRATCYDHLRQYAEAVKNYKAFLAASNGQFPDDEWKARHRLIAIEPEAKRMK